MKEIEMTSPRGADRSKLIKSEIEIHSKLMHENIVKFYECFQKEKLYYIVLELCSNHSLYELRKRRLRITEPECRYFAKQIIFGCQYLHSNGYIHRDLKLENLLLNSDMIVKIADFGLSAKVKENILNRTMCGTTSYMAPELLQHITYDYKVDIWAIGCILYLLLVGFYPFPVKENENMIEKVKGELTIPRNFCSNSKQILMKLLEKDPNDRPNTFEILELAFFNEYTPDSLPISALTMIPRFDCLQFNKSLSQDLMITVFNIDSGLSNLDDDVKHNKKFYLDNLQKLLLKIINESPIINNSNMEIELLLDLMKDSEDPSLAPIYWVSKWVDFSDRFGLGYKLTDASTGVIFVDKTKLILTENKQNIQYIDENHTEYLYTVENCPEGLRKKRKILELMEEYMQQNLATAGEKKVYGDKDAMIRLPYLDNAVRTETSIALYLNNGTLQFNFFQDHSKFVLCPIMGALTYIKTPDIFRTFKLEDLGVNGMTSELKEKLKYCLRKLACL